MGLLGLRSLARLSRARREAELDFAHKDIMKFARSLIIAVSTCGIVVSGSTCVAQEQANMSAILAERVAQLEATWKAGAGMQEHDYYTNANRIAGDLVGYEQNAANDAAVDLLRKIRSKRSSSIEASDADFEVGATDLIATQTLTRYLLENDAVSPSKRHAKLRVLAQVLGDVRAEMQPNYVQRQVVANVQPPPGGEGIRIAGMNPKAIADPVAREKYEAAIRENKLANLMNKRQRELRRMDIEFAKPIVEYLGRVVATDATAVGIVHEAITSARLTDAEINKVTRRPTQ